MKKENKKGFTLVEVVVVIAIIGILIAVVVPSVIQYISKANIQKEENDALAAYTTFSTTCVDKTKVLSETNLFYYVGDHGYYVVSGSEVERYSSYSAFKEFMDANIDTYTFIDMTNMDCEDGKIKYVDSNVNPDDPSGGGGGEDKPSETIDDVDFYDISGISGQAGIYEYSFTSSNYEAQATDNFKVKGNMTLKNGLIYDEIGQEAAPRNAGDVVLNWNAFYNDDDSVVDLPKVNTQGTDTFGIAYYDEDGTLTKNQSSLSIGTVVNPLDTITLTTEKHYKEVYYVMVNLGLVGPSDTSTYDSDSATVTVTVTDPTSKGVKTVQLSKELDIVGGAYQKCLFISSEPLKGQISIKIEKDPTRNAPIFIESIWMSSAEYKYSSNSGEEEEKEVFTPTAEDLEKYEEDIQQAQSVVTGTEVSILGKVIYIDSSLISGSDNKFYVQVGNAGIACTTSGSDKRPNLNQIIKIHGTVQSNSSNDSLWMGGKEINCDESWKDDDGNAGYEFLTIDEDNTIVPINSWDLSNVPESEVDFDASSESSSKIGQRQFTRAGVTSLQITSTSSNSSILSGLVDDTLGYVELKGTTSSGQTLTIVAYENDLNYKKKQVLNQISKGDRITITNGLVYYKDSSSAVLGLYSISASVRLKFNTGSTIEILD